VSIDILERRIDRMKSVISRRQYDLTVILENVHDPHNIGAVLRTCDSVGIQEIYVVYTDPRLHKDGLKVGFNSSSGASQWLQVHFYGDLNECMTDVKDRYDTIYGTSIGEHSIDLYDLNMTLSCALLFGNEKDGLTPEAQQYVDQNFLISQYGFVQSLNISVACAVSLYEACRQRRSNGHYERNFGDHIEDQPLLDQYKAIHEQKKLNKINNKKI